MCHMEEIATGNVPFENLRVRPLREALQKLPGALAPGNLIHLNDLKSRKMKARNRI